MSHVLHHALDHLDRAAGAVSLLLNLADALGATDALVAWVWGLS